MPIYCRMGDNAKLHHMLEFGLSDLPLRGIESAIPLEGCWASRFYVFDYVIGG